MRHYLMGQRIHVISKVNPLRLLMTRPSSLNCKLAKWVILLSQYEMQFMPQKAIKGQVVADFLADHPFQELQNFMTISWTRLRKLTWSTLPQKNKWQLFFNGASRTSPEGNIVTGVGVALIFLHNYVIPCAFSLTEPCSNNISEYNALLIGMQFAEEIGVKNLEVYGDSKLIVNQVWREYEVWHKNFVPYHNATIDMAEKFKNFYIDHIQRQQNVHADALASLAASLALPVGATEKVLVTTMTCTF